MLSGPPARGQVVADSPPSRPASDPESPSDATGARSTSDRSWPAWLRSPVFIAFAACFALAALSAAVLPTVPSYDPWAWIVWGREVFDPHISFATGGGPSWKPLPVVFTAVYGLFGGAAPTLWVITARAGGLLALVAAYRLGSRLALAPAARSATGVAGPSRARVIQVGAGVIAVLGVALTQDWAYYMFRGTSEPTLVAASLWAVERHLAGRRGQAFAFAVAAALIRPEAWPFLGVYGIWLWRKEPGLRLLVVAGFASIPFLWFVPPWIGSGQPFLAASHAKSYNGHLGKHHALEALRRAGDLQVLPVLIAAVVATALAWFRDRDRVTVALFGGALAWIVLVVAMVVAGYPGLERFFLPAAGIFCVLAGAGIARVAMLAGGGVATLVLGAALVAVSIPLSTSRIDTARAQKPLADRAVTILDELSAAVGAAGGHARVFPCRSSFSAVNHGVQTALAWKLHVTLGRVGTTLRKPGVLFVGPHNTIDGGPASVSPGLQKRLVARAGVWRVYRVTRPGASNRCVGR
jgi:hypothetical protein